eukprot:TRINITY_DN17205_c0_g1_i1.p1 TRINITY_DN17205_c0_g1~~TRINITY_DN17205_c0_g1_i1.p1  ORF type:complete len:567 (+),score=182.14 TRINITY_DN17205_c0_g1_i1:63-1763(+)
MADLAGCSDAMDACGAGLWDAFVRYVEGSIGVFANLQGTPEAELRETVVEFFAAEGVRPSAVLRGQVMRQLLLWARPAAPLPEVAYADAGQVDDARSQLRADIGALSAQRQEIEAAAECYAAHVPHVEAVVARACKDVRGCCDRLRKQLAERESILLAEMQAILDSEASRAEAAQEAAAELRDEVARAEDMAAAVLASGSGGAAVAARDGIRSKRLQLAAECLLPPQLTEIRIAVALGDGEERIAEAISDLGSFDAVRGRPHAVAALAGAVAASVCRMHIGVWVDLSRPAPAGSPLRCHSHLPAAAWDDMAESPPTVDDPLSIGEHLLQLIWEMNSPQPWRGPAFESPTRSRMRSLDEAFFAATGVNYAGALLLPTTPLQVREDCWTGPRGYQLQFEGRRSLTAAEVELVVPSAVAGRVLIVRRSEDGVPETIAQGTDFIGNGRSWYVSEFSPPVVLRDGDGVLWHVDEPGARDCYVHDGQIPGVSRSIDESLSVCSRYGRTMEASAWSVQMRLLITPPQLLVEHAEPVRLQPELLPAAELPFAPPDPSPLPEQQRESEPVLVATP